MKFSPQQDEALQRVADWLRRGDQPIFRLFGYAGTGKTTRSRVTSRKGSRGASSSPPSRQGGAGAALQGREIAKTLHSLIYRPRGEEAAEDETTGTARVSPTFSLNRQSPVAKAKLVVVDECSMVDEALGRDLLSSARRSWCSAIPASCPGFGWRLLYEADPTSS